MPCLSEYRNNSAALSIDISAGQIHLQFLTDEICGMMRHCQDFLSGIKLLGGTSQSTKSDTMVANVRQSEFMCHLIR